MSDPALSALADKLSLSLPILELLCQRGLRAEEEIRDFLNPRSRLLEDGPETEEMHKAVERIRRAVRDGEKILAFGDYDVDGTGGTAIVMHALRTLGAGASYFIPHRLRDGYGLKASFLDAARRKGYTLLITVDCGVRNVEEIAYGRRLGVDTIVLDHHLIGDELPEAAALVHTKVDRFPPHFSDLCGTGLSFALSRLLIGPEALGEYLSLVALATVTDMVPLRGENRALVRYTPGWLKSIHLPGLRALCQVSNLSEGMDPSFAFGFVLGPRINAAGRMSSAAYAVELFLAQDPKRAFEMARRLHKENQKRQAVQRRIEEEALEMVEAHPELAEDPILCLYDPGWHLGVVGIVAARLAGELGKPAIVLTETAPGIMKGSGRSIHGFPLHEAVERASGYVERFGGHQQAIGITLKAENFARFRQALREACHDLVQTQGQIALADLTLPIAAIRPELVRDYDRLYPFGPGNEEPVFYAEDAQMLGDRLTSRSHNSGISLACRFLPSPADDYPGSVRGSGRGRHLAGRGESGSPTLPAARQIERILYRLQTRGGTPLLEILHVLS